MKLILKILSFFAVTLVVGSGVYFAKQHNWFRKQPPPLILDSAANASGPDEKDSVEGSTVTETNLTRYSSVAISKDLVFMIRLRADHYKDEGDSASQGKPAVPVAESNKTVAEALVVKAGRIVASLEFDPVFDFQNVNGDLSTISSSISSSILAEAQGTVVIETKSSIDGNSCCEELARQLFVWDGASLYEGPSARGYAATTSFGFRQLGANCLQRFYKTKPDSGEYQATDQEKAESPVVNYYLKGGEFLSEMSANEKDLNIKKCLDSPGPSEKETDSNGSPEKE